MKNGENGRARPLAISRTLKHWLLILQATYTRTPLSEEQIFGYGMGLEDLTDRELEIGMRRVLRTWNFVAMPPPAFVRECVAGAMEEERNHVAAERIRRERVFEVPMPRLTLEEAWEDWDETQKLSAEYRVRLGIVKHETKAVVKKAEGNDLVLATNERLRELEKQKQLVMTKYPKHRRK